MKENRNPFADLQPTAVNHFKLCFYLAVLNAIQQVSSSLGSFEAAFKQFPFLAGYNNELADRGLAGMSSQDACNFWSESLALWQESADGHLPLIALGNTLGLDRTALTLLMTIGLVEEDARFGFMFEYLQGIPGHYRPTQGLLQSWFGHEEDLRRSLRRLLDTGVVQVGNADAPRSGWELQVATPLWDAIHADPTERFGDWAQLRRREQLPSLSSLALPVEIAQQVTALAALFASREAEAVVIRGPQHNGRRSLVGAVASMLDRNVLEVSGLGKPEDERWRLVGPLATLLHAMPLIVLEPAPGETVILPAFEGCDSPIGVVLGKQGVISGPAVERAITLSLKMPDVEARREHWRRALGLDSPQQLDLISESFRVTRGNIVRAARLAFSYAAVEGRKQVSPADVRQATRTLGRQTLETMARRVAPVGDWSQLAVTTQTLNDLRNLESRCRYRERIHLWSSLSRAADRNPGVRALFSGPSGTGKTLAAQLLAAELQMDLFRLDLSAIVNKYIGETEKNLDKVLARAEELDVMLLLDEGDSLLTQRTSVHTSNDRYANLETNYLLQRLEAFEGILIVTTNALDRIDKAFQRRMDVVIDFLAPDATERWNIWHLHLPAGHEIDEALLTEVAGRCVMTGGQIRNAALHASVLALEEGGTIKTGHLEAAVHREYRKLGAVCPLRRTVPLSLVSQ